MQIRSARDFAALIREQRKIQGLNQLQLAQLAGVSRDWIIQLEKGKTSVELGMVLRTLKVLGVRLDFAVDGGAGARDFRSDRVAEQPDYGQQLLPVIDLDQIVDGP